LWQWPEARGKRERAIPRSRDYPAVAGQKEGAKGERGKARGQRRKGKGERLEDRGECPNPRVRDFCALLCLFAAMARGERGKGKGDPAVAGS
jgi:hypothetical protein